MTISSPQTAEMQKLNSARSKKKWSFYVVRGGGGEEEDKGKKRVMSLEGDDLVIQP